MVFGVTTDSPPDLTGPRGENSANSRFGPQVPPDLPALPPASPALRLLTSPNFRRRVPLPVALASVRALNDARWRSEGYRSWCRRSMHFLLDASPRASEADALAKEFGYWSLKRSELLWHPHRLATLPVRGMQTLHAARAEHRGVILSFNHHGWFLGLLSSIRRAGVPLHVAVADHYIVDTPKPGYHGRHDRQHLFNTARAGRAFNAVGSFPQIRDLLGDGEAVALAFDVPGPAETTVLGRTVYAAPGIARTAMTTRALIVPATSHPDGKVGRVQIEQTLDPDDFGSVEELHAAVVSRHEPALLNWPEAMEWPLLRWDDAPPTPRVNPAGGKEGPR